MSARADHGFDDGPPLGACGAMGDYGFRNPWILIWFGPFGLRKLGLLIGSGIGLKCNWVVLGFKSSAGLLLGSGVMGYWVSIWACLGR